MREIPLTQGKITVVDDDDYEYLSQWKWYFQKNYAARNQTKSEFKDGLRKSIFMHKVIMKTPDNMDTDHINGNKLDNRKSNLRVCTRSENQANVFNRKDNKSGYKGVAWCKEKGKWQAYINANGKRIHLGFYKNSQDAAEAYNNAAAHIFGDYARVNAL